ncbi:hypothetical protein NX059_002376 [Plenodomus lindquistii]|nr:hypothetical protein NX059_002376 [Plenodomus lindquistii]
MSFLLRTTLRTLRSTPQPTTSLRTFSASPLSSIKVDSNFISQITAAEKTLTNSDEPVKGGPTAQAQSHAGQELSASIVSAITAGEKVITNSDEPAKGGPTSVAQSALVGGNVQDTGRVKNTSNSSKILSEVQSQASGTLNSSSSSSSANQATGEEHTGKLDSSTISKITDAEKQLSGEEGAVAGGPTAQAQKHANEPITSQALHDITEGEKKITGGERVKGGPTSTAQSELAKSRQN